MSKNTKVILAGCAIFLSIIILLVTATPASSGSEISLLEARVNADQYKDRYLTTEGFLQPGSVDWNPDKVELRFTIEDDENNQLQVFHHGVKPDNFSDDVIVIVHGYLKDGLFEAERVQTRCPSVYEGEDPDDYDEEFHRNLLRENKDEE
ncbi:cytochrome c-type biogenesis protein CcmE [Evansella caseinilytica]|uniref:Cytochrome c-type biogenesis protein CcmE n=1 Tax=Evansella caseinilytica TaxID=1503961 RepID=A0A1H3UXM1_9BACI|nr:cytochrome c maturation protein CcmE [Evansella caseinilytica]SDZ67190.1 cytochrome c-type biogenesis protein CcmE [Evansella caseinilytica]